jgi:hypothetical protein
VRKHIVAQVGSSRYRIAWLSLQPDGSISVGLHDRTYISPRLREQISLWNAYNRVRIDYFLPSDPSALEPVINPHFTFHPPVSFHLKANGDEAIFEGIADVRITLEQESRMPWLRATSRPLHEFRSSNIRPDNIETEDLVVQAPTANASIRVEVDFLRPGAFPEAADSSRWVILTGGVALQVAVYFTHPRIATLWWFHFY